MTGSHTKTGNCSVENVGDRRILISNPDLPSAGEMCARKRVEQTKNKQERDKMKKYFALLLAVTFILAACGGSGASTTINVTMTDFHFEPAAFTVPAGQEITLNAVNNGAVKHEFVIFKLGTDAGEKFGDEDEENIYWEMEVEPGQSVTATFTAPAEPGEYFVTCGIEGHMEAGMNGKLIVVAGQ
jgi:uncharacterized cupredoxin-like copper-binding protein